MLIKHFQMFLQSIKTSIGLFLANKLLSKNNNLNDIKNKIKVIKILIFIVEVKNYKKYFLTLNSAKKINSSFNKATKEMEFLTIVCDSLGKKILKVDDRITDFKARECFDYFTNNQNKSINVNDFITKYIKNCIEILDYLENIVDDQDYSFTYESLFLNMLLDNIRQTLISFKELLD